MSWHRTIPDSEVFTYEYFLFDDVCRLCWNRDADRDIDKKCSINCEETKLSLADKIKDCLDIDIDNDQPNKLCESCSDYMENFYNFKIFCRETDSKLRDILKKGSAKSAFVETVSEDIKIENNESCSNFKITKTNSVDSFSDEIEQGTESDHVQPVSETKPKKYVKTAKKHLSKRSPTYCNICCFDLECKEELYEHNAKCHGFEQDKAVYRCFGCEKKFKSRKTCISHERNFCKGLEDGYKCSLCVRYLPCRRMYESHMRDHRYNVSAELPEDIFKCGKCGKHFKTRSSLKNHSVEHEDKKSFVCDLCGRVFSRQDYLLKHKLMHAGVKNHKCPHCDFKATQRSSLTVHLRKHTGERPYSCDMCPQKCISSSNLRAHRRSHLGLKKYECTICNKKFGYKTSLAEHISSTHERSEHHTCHHCGVTYTRVRDLKRHLAAKHGKNAKVDAENEQNKKNTESTNEGSEKILRTVSYDLKEDEFLNKTQNGVLF